MRRVVSSCDVCGRLESQSLGRNGAVPAPVPEIPLGWEYGQLGLTCNECRHKYTTAFLAFTNKFVAEQRAAQEAHERALEITP